MIACLRRAVVLRQLADRAVVPTYRRVLSTPYLAYFLLVIEVLYHACMMGFETADDTKQSLSDAGRDWFEHFQQGLLVVLVLIIGGLSGYGVYAAFRDAPKVDAALPTPTRTPLTPMPTRRDPALVSVTPTAMPWSTPSATPLAPSPTGYQARQTYSRPADHFAVQLPAGWTSFESSDTAHVYFGPIGSSSQPVTLQVDHNRYDTTIDITSYVQAGQTVTSSIETAVGGQTARWITLSGGPTAMVVKTAYGGNSYTFYLTDRSFQGQFADFLNGWRFN